MNYDIEHFLEDLNHIIKIQGYSGNWNYDPYMHGMYNGLILARSLLTLETEFKSAPDVWLKDVEVENSVSVSEEDTE